MKFLQLMGVLMVSLSIHSVFFFTLHTCAWLGCFVFLSIAVAVLMQTDFCGTLMVEFLYIYLHKLLLFIFHLHGGEGWECPCPL